MINKDSKRIPRKMKKELKKTLEGRNVNKERFEQLCTKEKLSDEECKFMYKYLEKNTSSVSKLGITLKNQIADWRLKTYYQGKTEQEDICELDYKLDIRNLSLYKLFNPDKVYYDSKQKKYFTQKAVYIDGFGKKHLTTDVYQKAKKLSPQVDFVGFGRLFDCEPKIISNPTFYQKIGAIYKYL